MSKVDWNNAPKTATHYAGGKFWMADPDTGRPRMFIGGEITRHAGGSLSVMASLIDYQERPPAQLVDVDWPDENRIDVIASNGPTGEHYDKSGLTTAADFLSEGMRILTERGQQYGSSERECSFPQVAQAFNAITGKQLVGSDICLILALVKQVRQYAQPERFHEDSAVDGVNYTALQAEQLKRERSK